MEYENPVDRYLAARKELNEWSDKVDTWQQERRDGKPYRPFPGGVGVGKNLQQKTLDRRVRQVFPQPFGKIFE
jgi:hypothetical protein